MLLLLFCGCCKDLLSGQRMRREIVGRATTSMMECLFYCNPFCTEEGRCYKNQYVCLDVEKKLCQLDKTLLCWLEEQFVTRELFSKAKAKDATFVQKMYFNSLLGYYQRIMNFRSHCDTSFLCLCFLYSVCLCFVIETSFCTIKYRKNTLQ